MGFFPQCGLGGSVSSLKASDLDFSVIVKLLGKYKNCLYFLYKSQSFSS